MLVHVTPFLDESRASHLGRLAQANGFSDGREVLPPQPDGARLKVSSLSAQPAAGLVQQTLSARFIQISPRRFCPLCLQGQPYWRHAWELSFSVICPRHGAWLQDRCAHCGECVGFWDVASTLCWSCDLPYELGEDVRDHDDQIARQLALILIRSSQDSGWKADLADYHVGWQTAQVMPYGQLCELVLLLGSYSLRDRCKPRKVAFKTDVENARRIVCAAAHVLDPWPSAYHQFLRRNGDAKGRTVAASLGPFYRTLYREFTDMEAGFLKSELESYLKENWAGVLTHRNSRLPAALLSTQRMVSATALAKEQRIPRRHLVRGVEEGRIPGSIETLPSGRKRVCVEREELRTARNSLRLLNLEQAAHHLGLSGTLVKDLFEAGYIKALPAVRGGTWCITPASLDTFTSALKPRPCESVQNMKSVAVISRYFPAISGRFILFIESLLAGRVALFADSGKAAPIFESLYVPVSEIRRWQLQNEGYLSIPHAAELLGLKQQVAYHLAKRGLLPVVMEENLTSRVEAAGIKSFCEELVSAKAIALHHGISSRGVISNFKAKGALPISGPAIDGGRQYFFALAVLKRLGLIDGLEPNHETD